MDQESDHAKKSGHIYALIFGVVGIIGFRLFGPFFFERPAGGGINFSQVLWAGIVAAVMSGVGYGVGIAIGRSRK